MALRLLILSLGWLMAFAACHAGSDFASTPAPADLAAGGPESLCARNAEGACIVASDACHPRGVYVADNNDVCSACQGEDAEIVVCGAPAEAPCFDLESPSGGTCQRCITSMGEVLYDDCSREFSDSAHVCEEVQRASAGFSPVSEPNCAEDIDCGSNEICVHENEEALGTCVSTEDIVLCSVCTDEEGNVIEESCRPPAEFCADTIDAHGRICTECFREGESVWRACETPDLNPDRCEVYGDEAGRCVDCYGASGEMLSHQCSVRDLATRAESAVSGPANGSDSEVGHASSSTGFCDSYLLPGGIACDACYDDDGNLLSETCAQSEPELRCEQLRFTEQICTVCIDLDGNAQFTECIRNDCIEGVDACDAPPSCEVRSTGDDTYCRVCPLGTTGETETRCLLGGALMCRFEDDFQEIDSGTSQDNLTSRVCTVCSVESEGTSEVIYRHCGENVEAPLCVQYTEEEGACQVCFDTETQAELYSTCSWTLSPFHLPAGVAGMCSPLVAQTLVNEEGAPIWRPDETPGAEPPVAVDCSRCDLESPDGTGSFAACRVRAGNCSEAENQGPAPVLCTAQVRTYEYTRDVCQPPPWGDAIGGVGVRAMLSWLIGQQGVAAWNGSYFEIGGQASCGSCVCPNAPLFRVEAAVHQASILQSLGFVIVD